MNAVNAGGERATAFGLKIRHKIVYRAVNDLVPYARNAREHSPAQIKKLAAIITEFGFNVPVLLEPDGTIVAGHGRLLAARSLGLAEVPTIELGELSPLQRQQYRLADNRIALESKWNDDLLEQELAAIAGAGGDLALTGFSDAEVEKLLEDADAAAQGTARDPEATPDEPPEPVSQPGDVWLLGGHRLLCGSSIAPADVARVLAGEKPNLMVTDPPYGVNYDAGWRNDVFRQDGTRVGASATGKVLNDDRADWTDAWRLFPGNVAYVWHGGLHCGVVAASLAAVGFALKAQIIWLKTNPVMSRGHYNWQHEPALYAVRDAAVANWQQVIEADHAAVDRFCFDHDVAAYAVRDGEVQNWRGNHKQSTVWEIEHRKSDTKHSTQKPVRCMHQPMVNNSARGDAVYEPFSGSGTSIIAAEMLGRRCHAIELNPAYVDVAVERWQKFTGRAAVLEGDGRTFAQLAAERLAVAAA